MQKRRDLLFKEFFGWARKLAHLIGTHKSQTKARIEASAVKFAATGQTSQGVSRAADPGKFERACRATIKETSPPRANGKRELMTARFIGETEIGAGDAPFGAVRRDSPAAGARLGKEVGQLVAQSAIDLVRAMLAEARVKGNEGVIHIGAPGGAAHAPVPFHAHGGGEPV
jgi:hypothetical protein